MTVLRILHLHSSFHAGGKELRAARLMNAFGQGARHTVVSAEPGALGAAAAVGPGIAVSYPDDFPPLTGKPLPGRLKRLAQAMKGYDLVLSYNWGAMDGALAHTLFRDHLHLPPLVHHEDGFNHDEAAGPKTMRNWYRRLALFKAAALVVPSRSLEAIALSRWAQPRARVYRIPNGIAISRFQGQPKPDALPRVIKRKGELWLGTLAGLRPVKNLPRLVRAFAALPEPWQLVIVGEGPDRAAITDQAMRLGISHRVHLPGFVSDPAGVVGLFDLFALSSDSEQFPICVVEAMAAGLAVVSPDVGDVAAMLAPENRPCIAPAGDETALASCLAGLAADADSRTRIGEANRRLALELYDEKMMIEAYARVYGDVLGQRSFP